MVIKKTSRFKSFRRCKKYTGAALRGLGAFQVKVQTATGLTHPEVDRLKLKKI